MPGALEPYLLLHDLDPHGVGRTVPRPVQGIGEVHGLADLLTGQLQVTWIGTDFFKLADGLPDGQGLVQLGNPNTILSRPDQAAFGPFNFIFLNLLHINSLCFFFSHARVEPGCGRGRPCNSRNFMYYNCLR